MKVKRRMVSHATETGAWPCARDAPLMWYDALSGAASTAARRQWTAPPVYSEERRVARVELGSHEGGAGDV